MGRVPLEPCTRVGSHTAPCPWVGSYRDPQTRVGPIQSPLHGSGPVWPHTDHRSYRDPRPQLCPTAALTHGWGPPPLPQGTTARGRPPPTPFGAPPPRPPRGFPPSVTPTHSRGGTPWGAGGGGPTPPPMGHPHGGTPHSPPLPHPRNPHGGKAGGWGWGTVRKWGGGHWGGAAGPPALTRVTQELHSQAGSSGDPSRVTGTPGGSQGRRWGRGSPRRGGPRRSHRGAAEDTMGTRER